MTAQLVSRDAAIRLLSLRLSAVLPELLRTAHALEGTISPRRDHLFPQGFLPLTNLCRDYCSYCTYRRDPGQPGAHTMSPDEVLAVAKAG